jgi:hypothetical protein
MKLNESLMSKSLNSLLALNIICGYIGLVGMVLQRYGSTV